MDRKEWEIEQDDELLESFLKERIGEDAFEMLEEADLMWQVAESVREEFPEEWRRHLDDEAAAAEGRAIDNAVDSYREQQWLNSIESNEDR